MRNVQGSGAGDEKDAVAFVNSRFRQAIPHFPEEWLVRYLTGSIASLVGPAVIRKRMRGIMRNHG